ncbi:MAG: hypothetical protein H0T68_12630 [Gemmatimonadales bacterium]|nr:hypothetical protein [Gemmatimonadales bacterium]
MVGLGNTFGGIGGTLEYFLVPSRISMVAGLGQLPGAGTTGGGGLRAYSAGDRHRLFVEAAVAPLAVSDAIGFSDSRT